MHTFLWQDWTTLKGVSGSGDIIQSDTTWIEAERFEELVFWLDLRGVSSSPSVQLRYETAPTKDALLFTPMVAALDLSSIGANTTTVTPALAQTATAPPSRWVRWRLGPATPAAWNATFRIWVAVSAASIR